MPVRLHFGIVVVAALASAVPSSAVQLTTPQPPGIDSAIVASLPWRALGRWPAAAPEITRVVTDNNFPYRVCALSAVNGAWCVTSRERDTPEWLRAPAAATGAITPDPIDPEVFYTDQLVRIDRRTEQATFVHPRLANQLQTGGVSGAVLAFAPDGRTLLAGLESVWRTSTGGQSWTDLGADLGGATASALVASPIDARVLWVGTSTGRVVISRDGGTTWTSHAPDEGSDARVVSLEASRFDTNSAYAVVAIRGGGSRLWRTRDNGISWTDIGRGLPGAGNAAVVREDPFRRGLLFAATDRSVAFSIDDGERWQSLQANLPNAPAFDLTVREADLIVATGAQGVWMLEDIAPLRQLTADVSRSDAFLFRPSPTWRIRSSPSDPPPGTTHEGAWLSYLTGPTLGTPVTIEIIETVTGDVIRRFSTDESQRQPGDPLINRTPGLHRVYWDLHYGRPEVDPDAPPAARVLPGSYQVRLVTPARNLRQAIVVRMDPRVRTTLADLTAQRTLARALDDKRGQVARALAGARAGGEPADRAVALGQVRDELRRVSRAVNAADARPSTALAAAADAALARAADLLPVAP